MTLRVKVHPGARSSRVVRWDGEVLRVDVAAPPTDGRANAELVRLLAETLGLRRDEVVIRAGAGARLKLVTLPDDAASTLTAIGAPRRGPESG